MDNQTLTITDNRTNQTYTLPIHRGTIPAMDLRQIKAGPEDFGLMTYDPAFMNTASCQSAITTRSSGRRLHPIPSARSRCPRPGSSMRWRGISAT